MDEESGSSLGMSLVPRVLAPVCKMVGSRIKSVRGQGSLFPLQKLRRQETGAVSPGSPVCLCNLSLWFI